MTLATTFGGNLNRLDELTKFFPREAVEILRSILVPDAGYVRYNGTLHLTGRTDTSGEKGSKLAALWLGPDAEVLNEGHIYGLFHWCIATDAMRVSEAVGERSTDIGEPKREYYVRARELTGPHGDAFGEPFDLQIIATGDQIPSVRAGDVFWYVRDKDKNPISPGTSRRWVPFQSLEYVPEYGVISLNQRKPIIQNGRIAYSALPVSRSGGEGCVFINSGIAINRGEIGLCTVAGEEPTTCRLATGKWPHGVSEGQFCGPVRESFGMAPHSCGYMIVAVPDSGPKDTVIVLRNAADNARMALLTESTSAVAITDNQGWINQFNWDSELYGASARIYYLDGSRRMRLSDDAVSVISLGTHGRGVLEIPAGSTVMLRWWPMFGRWILESEQIVFKTHHVVAYEPSVYDNGACFYDYEFDLPDSWNGFSWGGTTGHSVCVNFESYWPSAPEAAPPPGLVPSVDEILAPPANPRDMDDVVRVISVCEACPGNHYDPIRFCNILDCEKKTKALWQSADGHCPEGYW